MAIIKGRFSLPFYTTKKISITLIVLPAIQREIVRIKLISHSFILYAFKGGIHVSGNIAKTRKEICWLD